MSKYLITISSRASIGDAARKMADNRIRRLVVVDDVGKVTGLITMTDLIRWMASQEKLTDSLMKYLMYDV